MTDKRRAKVIQLERKARAAAPYSNELTLAEFKALSVHEQINYLKQINQRRVAMERELGINPTRSEEIRQQLKKRLLNDRTSD
ncbi:MAG: hypothetical protein KKC30_10580 [Proteobacteria bacterium]|nr:hypothetical protein [Pseudomonadota bacterium]MBU4385338.1 hypothetical protein [Pseudomonadota bacterium]MCG2764532.1 hypothetical protein [Desulfarculaceae bacterium]